MSGVAAAIGGAAIIGAVSSRSSSKRAAETAEKTSDAQLAYMKQAEDRARADINRLFPQAQQQRNLGYQRSMDMLSQAMPMTIDAMQQGNMNAQSVLAGGAQQMQNAILGGPVNYDFMQPQAVNVDYQSLLDNVPKVQNQMQRDDAGVYGPIDTRAVMNNPFAGPASQYGNIAQYNAPAAFNQDVLAQLGGYQSGTAASYSLPNGGRTSFFDTFNKAN